jgi:esterase/lipase superfamily enzyme
VVSANGRVEFDPRSSDPRGLQFGVSTVRIPPTHEKGELERPEIWRWELANPDRHFIVTNTEPLSVGGFYDRLSRAMRSSGSEAFIFIHGYNVSFEDAVLRTAQLFHDLEFSGVPILFSWPAQDAWWRYTAAEDQATAAVPYLQEFIRGVVLAGKPKAINVIAHSMGNRVLVNAVHSVMQTPDIQGTALFQNMVLAAPDVSLDNFRAVEASVKQAAARVTVYASSQDVPLRLSNWLHDLQRLGQAPPLSVPVGIDAIDASAVTQDLLGHSYFSHSQKLLLDMILLIRDGLLPPRRSLEPVPTKGPTKYWRVVR